MALAGIKVVLRERPKDRESWSPYAFFGWYIFLSLEHYRCHQICIPSTNSVHIGQTVSWFLQKLIMRTSAATHIIIATAKN